MPDLAGTIAAAARQIAEILAVDAGERIDALTVGLSGLARGACELRLSPSGRGAPKAIDAQLVVASGSPPPPGMLALARSMSGSGDVVSRWIDAVDRALHWGIHAPLSGAGARVFARWQASLEDAASFLERCGAPVDRQAASAALDETAAIAERSFVDMVSLDLFGSSPRYLAHVSLPERGRSGRGLGPRIGRLVGARLAGTPWPERWVERGPAILASSAAGVYATLEPGVSPQLELALGSTSRDELGPVAAALGCAADLEATSAVLDALDVRWLSQVTAALEPDGSATLAVFARVAP